MRTSYFSLYKKPDAVGIAMVTPDWYGPCRTYPDLFPKKSFLFKYKKDHNEEDYIQAYYEQVLSKLDPEKVYEDLKDNTLLCWEKAGKFCHRRLVAAWLELSLGVEVPEYNPVGDLFNGRSILH